MSEKVSVKWNEFPSQVSQSLAALRLEDYLSDVTLLTEDQVHMSAHKFVLSSSSSFFQSIFRQNVHSHPLLYLSDVHSGTLKLVMDYVYQGEAQMSQNELKIFLKVADKLKIQDLTDLEDNVVDSAEDIENSTEKDNPVNTMEGLEIEDDNHENVKDFEAKGDIISNLDKDLSKKQKIRDLFLVKDQDNLMTKTMKQESFANNRYEFFSKPFRSNDGGLKYNNEGLEYNEGVSKYNDETTKYNDLSGNGMIKKLQLVKKEGYYQCQDCDYFSLKRDHALTHVERHMQGMTYYCTFCNEEFKTKASAQGHLRKSHPDVKGAKALSKLTVSKTSYIDISTISAQVQD